MQINDLNDTAIEELIKSAGLDKIRLTPNDIDKVIVNQQYYVFPGTVLTVCCLTLRNGFNVVGDSAPTNPQNFDEEIGKQIAYAEARNKIWQLEGYLLKEMLHNA